MAIKRGRSITSFGQFFGGLSGGTSSEILATTTPLERILVIGFEERRLVVPAESRVLQVQYEDRRLIIK